MMRILWSAFETKLKKLIGCLVTINLACHIMSQKCKPKRLRISREIIHQTRSFELLGPVDTNQMDVPCFTVLGFPTLCNVCALQDSGHISFSITDKHPQWKKKTALFHHNTEAFHWETALHSRAFTISSYIQGHVDITVPSLNILDAVTSVTF